LVGNAQCQQAALKRISITGSLYSPGSKEYILLTSSVKAPDPKGRKALGGTDGSSWDKGCSLASQVCDEGNNSNELSGGIGGSLELDNGGDDCVEPGGRGSMNVIVDQSKSCQISEESSEWIEGAIEADKTGGSTGIGNCNKESCSEPKLFDELDGAVAPCRGSRGSRSCDERSELGT
jgi:hypothetical protein